jgi:hypothetical protein
MKTRDALRVVKIDCEISNLTEQIERHLRVESEIGARYFLRSKSLKLQLEKLEKKRKLLIKHSGVYLSKEDSYLLELSERKDAVEAAQLEVDSVKINLIILSAALVVSFSESLREEINIQTRLLRSKKLVLANKARALANWREKDYDAPNKQRPAISEQHTESILIDDKKIENTIIETLLPDDILSKNHNWDINPLVTEVSIPERFEDDSGVVDMQGNSVFRIDALDKIKNKEIEDEQVPRKRFTI